MKTDCLCFDMCRKSVEQCNENCDLYIKSSVKHNDFDIVWNKFISKGGTFHFSLKNGVIAKIKNERPICLNL